MNITNIEKLKKGDFFKLKSDSNRVYVFDGYNRSFKKYEFHQYWNISAFHLKKKGTKVFINFTF